MGETTIIFETTSLSDEVDVTTTPKIGGMGARYVVLGAPPMLAAAASSPTPPTMLIGSDSRICGGAPIILGTRLTVHHIISLMEELGWDAIDILAEYPQLSQQQIAAAQQYHRAHRAEVNRLIRREHIAARQ